MKKFKDGFEGKKVYSYEQISPLGDPKEEKAGKGKVPNCFGSIQKIIKNSSVINYEGGSEVLNCKCGNHKATIEAKYEFIAETEEQLVSTLDMSSIKISIYKRVNREKK